MKSFFIFLFLSIFFFDSFASELTIRFNTKAKSFDKNKPVVIITHGHGGTHKDRSVTVIEDAYWSTGEYNIITLDWRKYASLFYPLALPYVDKVGAALAKNINDLVNVIGIKPKDITLVGHSLGAHIMGSASRQAQHKVGRIVGLDPAGPLIGSSWLPTVQKLGRSDAKVVEVIHSATNLLGIKETCGHVDFYPNGGVHQPGCDNYSNCSHLRAYYLYAEAIKSPGSLIGLKCANYNEFLAGNCAEDTLAIAFGTEHISWGKYYLKTNGNKPFGRGLDGITKPWKKTQQPEHWIPEKSTEAPKTEHWVPDKVEKPTEPPKTEYWGPEKVEKPTEPPKTEYWGPEKVEKPDEAPKKELWVIEPDDKSTEPPKTEHWKTDETVEKPDEPPKPEHCVLDPETNVDKPVFLGGDDIIFPSDEPKPGIWKPSIDNEAINQPLDLGLEGILKLSEEPQTENWKPNENVHVAKPINVGLDLDAIIKPSKQLKRNSIDPRM